jgi:hypothetical protein
MDILSHFIVWLNAAANALGSVLLAPIAAMPGWLSATLVAAATGVLLLLVFKYTSNQRAIKRVRNDIKANLLALKLFKDNIAVSLKAQARLFWGAFWLLVLAVVPMLVMALPVLLLLGQLALWYQARPLQIGEDTVVTLKLNSDSESAWPDVRLTPTKAADISTGPVRIGSQRALCWKITARQSGYHHLVFQVDGQAVDKELAIGDGFMRVSTQRPRWPWDALLNPAEPPFGPDAAVQSIEIDYPQRSSWTSGTQPQLLGMPAWVAYWLVVSMIAAFAFRGLFRVNI